MTALRDAEEAPELSKSGSNRGSRRETAVGVLAALAAALIGAAAWYAAAKTGEIIAAVVAVGVGALIGRAAVAGARGRGTVPLVIAAALLTVVANAAGQNFVQRSQLVDGIHQLDKEWPKLHVEPVPKTAQGQGVSAEEATAEAEKKGLSCDLIPKGVVIPPPQIVQVMPVGGFLCMAPENIAVVWTDIPDATRAQFPDDVRHQVEAILASQTADQLAATRAQYKATAYHIPEAVVACAPQPDFTQPNAAAGLGFPNGVPLLLPTADLFSGERVRGDGLDLAPATPICFMRENAKAHPIETGSWLAALAVAVVIPLRRRSGRPSLRPAAA